MSIEDGYFLGVALRGVDLTDLAAVRPRCSPTRTRASRTPPSRCRWRWMLGKVFHHAPAPLRPVRDFVFDHTPFLQKVAGDSNPREINKQLALIED